MPRSGMTKKQRIVLTEEMVNELQGHLDRTRLGSHALLSGRRNEKPEGLYPYTIDNWLSGHVKTVNANYFSYVIKLLESIPDYSAPEAVFRIKQTKRRPKLPDPTSGYKHIDQEVLLTLRGYRDKAYLPGPIFKLYPIAPSGLTTNIVSSWLSGTVKSGKEEYLRYVLDSCQEMETHPQRPIIVDQELRMTLKSLVNKSEVGGTVLLRGRSDVPDGFSSALISGLVNGHIQTARADHIAYLKSICKSMSRRAAGRRQRKKRSSRTNGRIGQIGNHADWLVVITDDDRKRLEFLDIDEILQNNPPVGLHRRIIQGWISGKFKTARKDYLDFVLKAR